MNPLGSTSLVVWVFALTVALAGCANPLPGLQGSTESVLVQRLGPPTGRHALEGGGTRLEFATGPYGRDTWMVDLDSQGRVRDWHNALEEPRLHALQQRLARQPLARSDLLRTLGRPGERVQGSASSWLAGGELWSWRYPTNDCLWFQATLAADGSVRDAGFNIDPRCDARADARD